MAKIEQKVKAYSSLVQPAYQFGQYCTKINEIIFSDLKNVLKLKYANHYNYHNSTKLIGTDSTYIHVFLNDFLL